MTDTIYRLSDDGLLECLGSDGLWGDVDCSDYGRYCGTWCSEMRVVGDRAYLKCRLDVDDNGKMHEIELKLVEG